MQPTPPVRGSKAGFASGGVGSLTLTDVIAKGTRPNRIYADACYELVGGVSACLDHLDTREAFSRSTVSR